MSALSTLRPRANRLANLTRTTSGKEALKAGAHIYLNFLSLTRRSGWVQGQLSKKNSEATCDERDDAQKYLMRSAMRYSQYQSMRKLDPALVPSSDMAVVWAADLKRPTARTLLLTNATDGETSEGGAVACAWYEHAQHMVLEAGQFEAASRVTPKPVAHRVGEMALCTMLGVYVASMCGAPPSVGVAIAASYGIFQGIPDGTVTTTGARATPAIQRFDCDGDGIVSVYCERAQGRARGLGDTARRHSGDVGTEDGDSVRRAECATPARLRQLPRRSGTRHARAG